MRNRRPRYMNEGGIASLMSNGGSEAMMLGLEGDAAALPGDLFSDEPDPRWLSHPEDEGYLPEAQIRRQLQRKAGSQIGEWLEDLTGMFDMQETYDEEVGILESGGPFDSLSPELMKSVAEGLVPGGGMVKMGKMGFGVLGRLFDAIKRGNASRKTSKRVKEMDELIRQSEEGMARRAPLHKKHEELMERLRSTRTGKRALKDVRKDLNMDEYSPKGQESRPPILGTDRWQRPEKPPYIPKKKPPKMWYGGAPLYKKGYYGKSYK